MWCEQSHTMIQHVPSTLTVTQVPRLAVTAAVLAEGSIRMIHRNKPMARSKEKVLMTNENKVVMRMSNDSGTNSKGSQKETLLMTGKKRLLVRVRHSFERSQKGQQKGKQPMMDEKWARHRHKRNKKDRQYLGLSLGLLAAGDLGETDSKESKSTKLYLPERTWRALALSSNAAPTFDLHRTDSGLSAKRTVVHLQWNEFGEHHPCLQILPQFLTCRNSQVEAVRPKFTCQALSLVSNAVKTLV